MLKTELLTIRVKKIKENGISGARSTHGESRDACWVWLWNLMEGKKFEHIGVDGRIILKWISRREMWGNGLDRSGSE